MTDYHAIAEGLKLPCIPFDEMATLLGQFWLVEPIPDVPYHYTLTTCPEIGHDIYEVVLSGFVCKSMINPPKRFIAVCELLEGEMNLQVGEHHFRAWPGELPPMVFSNVAKDEIQNIFRFENLKMRFFNVSLDDSLVALEDAHMLTSTMISEYNLSFTQVYEAINVYKGLGPLKPLSSCALSGRANELEEICVLLSNFAKGDYSLKKYAYSIDASIPSVSKKLIAGKKVSDWAKIYKIQLWKLHRDTMDASELSHLLGYSNPGKMKDFLKRVGEI